MNRNAIRSFTTLLYTKLYVVIYGLILLIISQSIPTSLNTYTLIFLRNPVTYLMSFILELTSLIGKYVTSVIMIIPLLLVEINRILSCCKLHILYLEILIFFLITGNIVFTFMYAILALLLTKPLRSFLPIDGKCGEMDRDGGRQHSYAEKVDIERDKSKRYAMMLISMGTSILTCIALTIIFRINIFIISILTYIIAIMVAYTHSRSCCNSATTVALISEAIITGVPPYGIISRLQC